MCNSSILEISCKVCKTCNLCWKEYFMRKLNTINSCLKSAFILYFDYFVLQELHFIIIFESTFEIKRCQLSSLPQSRTVGETKASLCFTVHNNQVHLTYTVNLPWRAGSDFPLIRADITFVKTSCQIHASKSLVYIQKFWEIFFVGGIRP